MIILAKIRANDFLIKDALFQDQIPTSSSSLSNPLILHNQLQYGQLILLLMTLVLMVLKSQLV